jgi:hypothetical protein
LGFALTFAPGNFAGAAVGRGLRTAVKDLANDPATWMTTRRAVLDSEAGSTTIGFLTGLPVDDELVVAARELAAAQREQMSRVWATFPHGADDAVKAAWYRQAASTDGIADHMRQILNGKAFQHEVYPLFDAHEVTIYRVDSITGERTATFRLDVMSKTEVVSLKNTQLAQVQESTAKTYIDELVKKYNPTSTDLIIARTDGNMSQLPSGVIGGNLKGQMVLGVPAQQAPIPQSIIDYAAKFRVEIRQIVTG